MGLGWYILATDRLQFPFLCSFIQQVFISFVADTIGAFSTCPPQLPAATTCITWLEAFSSCQSNFAEPIEKDRSAGEFIPTQEQSSTYS